MSTTPLKVDILDDGIRPRDWQPRRSSFKIPLKLVRLCVLGAFLPAVLVAGPIYLRYRVYSEQLYPLAVSDQRMIDAKVSTTWCQRQVVKANATFNAYLMRQEPEVKGETILVAMTRHLILEDDMKEYWGFYLLHDSSVTVSTCVRWPGASLTIIRGHKHLHECAFIGDDSSEELEELVQVAEERGLLNVNGSLRARDLDSGPSNEPEKMKRARQDVQFHHKGSTPDANSTLPETVAHHYSSHELDAKAMRNILTQLFIKTLDTKRKQKENPHHHYEGVYMESANIDKPPIMADDDDLTFIANSDEYENVAEKNTDDKGRIIITKDEWARYEGIKKLLENGSQKTERQVEATLGTNSSASGKLDNLSTSQRVNPRHLGEELEVTIDRSTSERATTPYTSTTNRSTIQETSVEVFQEVMRRIGPLGSRGKRVLEKLINEIAAQNHMEGESSRKLLDDTILKEKNERLIDQEKRRRRDLILSSPLHNELTRDDVDEDAAVEEDMLNPDGIAEDRGTVNETTLDDRSNTEFWSSFSSSEERLLECKGLILNLPLTPHRRCAPKYEGQHTVASLANTVTYRVPINGYYFFVFNSENEIQPNYLRVRFDLLKTVYNTSNPVHACENSTRECSLPLNFFSGERTVLELPLNGNDSQWNHEYVVVSTCEPRTAIYLICIVSVPLLILIFAFH